MTDLEQLRALIERIDATELTVDDRQALIDLLRAAFDASAPRHAMPSGFLP